MKIFRKNGFLKKFSKLFSENKITWYLFDEI
jgi:hypothetical protein